MASEGNFAQAAFAFAKAKDAFEDKLVELGLYFDKIGWDEYDNSLELYEVPNDTRLSAEAQQFLFDSGFKTIYVNDCDGWQTHYHGPDVVMNPWRRKILPGSFLQVNYIPKAWEKHVEQLFKDGKITVVPD